MRIVATKKFLIDRKKWKKMVKVGKKIEKIWVVRKL